MSKDCTMKSVVRRPIKVQFIDMWWLNKPQYEQDKIYRVLNKYYDVVISDEPDYVIDGGLGHEYINPKYEHAVKIARIGENYVPDFNYFDYAIGFDHIEFDDRYLRMPLFAFYKEFPKLAERDLKHPKPEELLNRKFCSFVVSNGGRGDPLRTEFFHELSKYKKVASGGKWLNNIGGPVKDKSEFCAKYKFNIAFENSVSSGYTTEKVMQPLTIHTVPIYYGNPTIEEDINPDCLVLLKSRNDVQRAIEEIIKLDEDDDLYLKKVFSPCLVHPIGWYEDRLEKFILNIIEQPIEDARRIIDYGYQPVLHKRLRHLYRVDDFIKFPMRFISRAMHNIYKNI